MKRDTRSERQVENVEVTDEEHQRHCHAAGCRHPAVYELGDMTVQGWCDLCRRVAFREVAS